MRTLRSARIEPQVRARREAGQDSDHERQLVPLRDSLALLALDGYGAEGLPLAGARDLDVGVRDRALVPGARPVVRGDVQLAIELHARDHGVLTPAGVARREHDPRLVGVDARLCLALAHEADQTLERDDD